MARDVGNQLQQARIIQLSAQRKVFRNRIGGSDPNDFYQFTTTRAGSLNLVMDKLKRNANVQLLDSQGTVLQTSALRGKQTERMGRSLDPGTYYIRVFSPRAETRYRLRLSVRDEAALPSLPNVRLAQFATGFQQPTFVTHAGDGSNRLFVTEKQGKIQIVDNGKPRAVPFLDISDRTSTDNEQGLLSVAFAPNYTNTGRFYVYYSDKDGNIVISRFQRSASDPNRADASSEQKIITIPHPSFKNHYGGQLAFGQDGFLYAATGDGGGSGDPSNNAQNRQSLLGKLLRLDVESPGVTTYRIPGNNPFVGDRDPQNLTRDEIWAVGLRNPWRFSFDRQTGNFYLADVGQDRVEEINFQAASDLGGQNYGWNVLEGTLPYPDASRSVMTNGFTAPVFQYSHDQSRSVTGGYVYRGTSIPGLEGTYVYGDFASGVLWGLRQTSTGRWQNQLLIDSPYRISTFGQDEQGSLYATDFFGNAETNGVVYRLELA